MSNLVVVKPGEDGWLERPEAAATELRRRLSRAVVGRKKNSRRYPSDLKTLAVQYTLHRRSGPKRVPMTRVATELGLTCQSLREWVSSSTGDGGPLMRPVQIIQNTAYRTPAMGAGVQMTIRVPTGLEIEMGSVPPHMCLELVGLAIMGSRANRG